MALPVYYTKHEVTLTRHTMYSCMLLLLRHLSQRYPQAARFACPHFSMVYRCSVQNAFVIPHPHPF